LKKIAIISSHPIQYNAPLFALIAKEAEIELKVFYTWGEDSIKEKFDPDFQQHIKWDIPLLEGYKYQFLKNTSKHPGSHHFKGIINLDLNNEIEKWGADIVWVWGWSFESHLKALRFFKGKKEVWFRGDSTLLDESSGFGIKKIIRRVFLTWVYRHVDKAFYVGTHNKAYFMKHGLKANQLIYAPHAVDNNRFTDPTGKHRKQAKEIRIQLGIPEKRKLLLYVGKFEPNKNLMELINAINDTDFNLLLVGNGPEEKILKQSASENIFFMPFQNQSNMPIIYRVGDALVLNSKSETWGLAINEALACGIPVIASNKCGGAIDLLDGGSGVVIKTIKKNTIEDAMMFISTNDFTSQFENERLKTIEEHSYPTILGYLLKQLRK
jgi:glycosyltransferase involved in cell wall biosynthesis